MGVGWDDCSDTPFIYNQRRETVVSYDDTYSLIDKAKYVEEVGMAGCFTWSLDQVRSQLGLGVVRCLLMNLWCCRMME